MVHQCAPPSLVCIFIMATSDMTNTRVRPYSYPIPQMKRQRAWLRDPLLLQRIVLCKLGPRGQFSTMTAMVPEAVAVRRDADAHIAQSLA